MENRDGWRFQKAFSDAAYDKVVLSLLQSPRAQALLALLDTRWATVGFSLQKT